MDRAKTDIIERLRNSREFVEATNEVLKIEGCHSLIILEGSEVVTKKPIFSKGKTFQSNILENTLSTDSDFSENGTLFCSISRKTVNRLEFTICIIGESSIIQRSVVDYIQSMLGFHLNLAITSHKNYLYRDLVEKSGDLIFELDGDGKLTYANPELIRVTGYSEEELMEMHFLELIDQDSFRATLDTLMKKIKNGEKSILYSCSIKSKDLKSKLFLELRLNMVYEEKWLSKIRGVARNITKRKLGEVKLKDTEKKLQSYKEGLKALNQISSDTELSTDQQIESALRVCTEFLQMDRGILSVIDASKYTISNIYSQNNNFTKGQELDLEATFSEVFYNKGDILTIENISKTTYSIHPAFSLFEVEAYIGSVYFVAGKKRGTVVFTAANPREEHFDINDKEFVRLLSRWIGFILQHQEYEKKLMLDKMVLQAFVASAPAAIAMLDKEYKFMAASDKWYQEYQLEDKFIIGQSYFDVIPGSSQDWNTIFQKVLEGHTESNSEDLVEREPGEIKWIKWEVRPWFLKLEVVGGLVIYTEDITESKDQQLQLKIAKRKAEQASSAKEQFLSTMSHEIRTPLNAIIGMTDVMLMDDQTAEQRKHLDLLKFSGDNLLVLINDILDFNKIEAGKLELEIRPFDLIQQLDKIKDSLENLVRKKELSFNLEVGSDVSFFVKADAMRLGQVLTNLVNNAIKFTEKGSVTLKVERLSMDDRIVKIRFSVIDTGIGIKADQIDKIFQSFEQADLDIGRKYGGSGLGLAISKKILQLMSSTIEVNSIFGEGSVFSFELDLETTEAPKKNNDPATLALQLRKDLKVLVAEDNPGNRILIESLFKRWDIDLEFAENGLEAVGKIKSKDFHLVLMDIQMPEMDGYEATTSIRGMSDEYFRKIPIIALTASVMSHVLEKTLEVGMNAYISKPFNPKELKELIATHTGFFAADSQVDSPEIVSISNLDTDSFPYLKSLIGEDPESLREIVTTTVRSILESSKGMIKGLELGDVTKVWQELHVLRPNLHNIELGDLVNELPSIKELSQENIKLIVALDKNIKNALSSPRLAIFI